ncbi:MAG: nucleotidyltransferase family protein [Thermodesulfobacteriota bacterium]
MNDKNVDFQSLLWKSVNRQDIYRIKEQILRTLSDMNLSVSRLILFGSRSREDFKSYSDYDILIVTNAGLHLQEKMRVFKKLREDLACLGFDVDIILKSEKEVDYYMTKCGSVVRNALREGITL